MELPTPQTRGGGKNKDANSTLEKSVSHVPAKVPRELRSERSKASSGHEEGQSISLSKVKGKGVSQITADVSV
jgi:hypothetical protein